MDMAPLKVTAFVLRESPEPALLLFRHPSAGFQLPAGTVALSERPEDAAVREVLEETGVHAQDPRCLHIETLTLPMGEGVYLGSQDPRTAPEPLLRRGLPVRIVAREGERAHVVHETRNYRMAGHPVLKTREAWVPAREIAVCVRRAFFLLRSDDPRTRLPPVTTDGHTFQPLWAPRATLPTLMGVQQAWLTRFTRALGGEFGDGLA